MQADKQLQGENICAFHKQDKSLVLTECFQQELTNSVFICKAYALCPKQYIKRDLSHPVALISLFNSELPKIQWHTFEIRDCLYGKQLTDGS